MNIYNQAKTSKKSRKYAPKNPPKNGYNRPFLTRSQFSKALGINIMALRMLEKAGRVQFMVDEHGWRWFDPDQVATVIGQRPLAKVAWRLFDEGKTVHEVVQAIDAEPQTIMQWHCAWLEASGYIVVELPRRDPRELADWLRAYNLRPQDIASPHLWFRALEMCLSTPALRKVLESRDPMPVPERFT